MATFDDDRATNIMIPDAMTVNPSMLERMTGESNRQKGRRVADDHRSLAVQDDQSDSFRDKLRAVNSLNSEHALWGNSSMPVSRLRTMSDVGKMVSTSEEDMRACRVSVARKTRSPNGAYVWTSSQRSCWVCERTA